MDDRAELLWERDTARAKLEPLQRENEHLRMLLGYAEAAIMAEYRRANSPSALPSTSTGESK